jgi:crotonobetainyl-CoA:carnitine CoA-transferase CaiB-like acyl-CoA transferase
LLGEGLLEGVRVLECALFGPGALGGHLADLGAEVIKVESPAGDDVRRVTWPIIDGVSLLHLHVNRGKQSLVLDLNLPEAATVFEELVTCSDVVIEGMRPGFLDRRGLGYERLRQLNPKVVFASISGYGTTGPYRDLPSHGVAYDTWAGSLRPELDDEGFCRIADQPNIGITAGPAFGAIGVLAALVRAERTGIGAAVEIAQADSSAYFDWYRIESWQAYEGSSDSEVTGNAADDYQRRAPGLGGMGDGVRYQIYESGDGHILFMAAERKFWSNFCAGVKRMDLFERWPGAEVADHARGNRALQSALRDIFRTRTTREWMVFAAQADTPIAPVNTPHSLRHDPQFQARFGWSSAMETGAEMLGLPLKVAGAAIVVPAKAPEVGQHTDAVLAAVLGYDDRKIAALRERRALG